jgi:hypothetical protein
MATAVAPTKSEGLWPQLIIIREPNAEPITCYRPAYCGGQGQASGPGEDSIYFDAAMRPEEARGGIT